MTVQERGTRYKSNTISSASVVTLKSPAIVMQLTIGGTVFDRSFISALRIDPCPRHRSQKLMQTIKLTIVNSVVNGPVIPHNNIMLVTFRMAVQTRVSPRETKFRISIWPPACLTPRLTLWLT